MKEKPESMHFKKPPYKSAKVDEVNELHREKKLLDSMTPEIKEIFINKIQIEPEDLAKIYDQTPKERLEYLEKRFMTNNSSEESLEKIVERINEALAEFKKNKKLTPPQE